MAMATRRLLEQVPHTGLAASQRSLRFRQVKHAMLRFNGAGPSRLGAGPLVLLYTSVLMCRPLDGVDGALMDAEEVALVDAVDGVWIDGLDLTSSCEVEETSGGRRTAGGVLLAIFGLL